MSKSYKYGNSTFWLDRFDNDIDNGLLSQSEKETQNLYKLAAQKRAIANFVSIVTTKEIPVRFASNGDSYTDGKSITISSKIENSEDFDPAVGLALHEGSHIKLSDFELLKNLDKAISHLPNYDELNKKSSECFIYMSSVIKDILNVVEDRRIDNFIYKTSPGYRSYYLSLYDKYFNDKIIDKGLQSDEYKTETLESYMFRLINIHSKYSKLDALKGLREIYQILNLSNIGRLKTTKEAFEVAVSIFEVILKYVHSNPDNHKNPYQNQQQNGQNGQQQNGENGEGDGNNESENLDDDSENNEGESQIDGNSEEDNMGGNSMNTNYSSKGKESESNSTNAKSSNSLSDRQKRMLSKKIQKQKEFIRGAIRKAKLSKANANTIEILSKAGAEIKTVGNEFESPRFSKSKVDCIFIKNMTKELMSDNSFPLTQYGYVYDLKDYGLHDYCSKSVEEGIRLGIVLGKKLQVRSESRDTIFNRQLLGKLDKRMISALGYGNEHVFYTKETDKYNKANLHISVDASGSMSGSKWAKTMVNVVALAKAVDMINNLDIQITFRTTSNDSLPYIILAYDSRKDKFVKVKNLFRYLRPNGTTPEGLCYEAIMDFMVEGNRNVDSYFLNISDGEPYYYGKQIEYTGRYAAKHTRKMIEKFKGMGVRILSYYVSDTSTIYSDSSSAEIFRQSYGNAANFINVTSVFEVSKTMNKLFLQK